MADTKISALPASTTPLAGTEVLPIVQSGATKKVSVADLTAGRAISATQLTLTTGNVIVASGQGIDFSANPNPAGTTSELLNDYQEGTYTPTATPTSGTLTSYSASGNYTKIGNRVFVSIQVVMTDNGTGANSLDVSLPFTVGAISAFSGQNASNINAIAGNVGVGATVVRIGKYDGSYPVATGEVLRISGNYSV